jgi:tagatose-1,6-bisphosphate aldolase non-catalytic subunit AgaZ/GatZ
VGSKQKRPALTQALLEKLIYIEDHKGPDGWTDAPVTKVLYNNYQAIIANVPAELFVFHSSGTKVKLSEGGLFLVKWCR